MKLTVDAIIRYNGGIVLEERVREPYGWSLPGGKVEDNETLEQAIEREVGEELGMGLANLKQFNTYSAPGRDPRFRAVSTVFTADGYGVPKALDGVKKVEVVQLGQLDAWADKLAFDHYRILSDYRGNANVPSQRDVLPDSGRYIVLHKRDRDTEKSKDYKTNEFLFDMIKNYKSLGEAKEFASDNDGMVLSLTDKPSSDYVIVAEHYGKYKSYCRDECDWVRTYDAIRCKAGDVETIKQMLDRSKDAQYLKKITVGVEVPLYATHF